MMALTIRFSVEGDCIVGVFVAFMLGNYDNSLVSKIIELDGLEGDNGNHGQCPDIIYLRLLPLLSTYLSEVGLVWYRSPKTLPGTTALRTGHHTEQPLLRYTN